MGGGGPSWSEPGRCPCVACGKDHEAADEVARLIVKIDDVKQRSNRMTVTLDASCMDALSRKLRFKAQPLDLAHLVEGFLSTFVNFDSKPPDTVAFRLGVLHGNAFYRPPTFRPQLGDGRIT